VFIEGKIYKKKIQTFLFVMLGVEMVCWKVAYRNCRNVARGRNEMMKTGSRFAHILEKDSGKFISSVF